MSKIKWIILRRVVALAVTVIRRVRARRRSSVVVRRGAVAGGWTEHGPRRWDYEPWVAQVWQRLDTPANQARVAELVRRLRAMPATRA